MIDNTPETFTFQYANGTKRIYHTVQENLLSDILMEFEEFLRGCGFYFEGSLDIVKEKTNEDFYGTNLDFFDNEIFEDEIFYFSDDTLDDNMSQQNSFQWTVDQLSAPTKNKCEVCKIDTSLMEGYSCWDSKCPGVKNGI